jgi:hypothetical protein
MYGADGAIFIIEGVMGGEYQAVQRWSPEEGAYLHAADFLLEEAFARPKSV